MSRDLIQSFLWRATVSRLELFRSLTDRCATIGSLMAKKLIAALSDSGLFLREWFANPQRTGAVAPSSPKLAAAMAHWLPADPDSFVLELGPGTGAVTEALIERGLREDRLVAIEKNPIMARLLRKRFPSAQIITGDAWHLDDLLRERREPIESVGAVISSLPLLNFPLLLRRQLVDGALERLAPGAPFIQFSYGTHAPVPPPPGHSVVRAAQVWANLPPARVWVYRKS